MHMWMQTMLLKSRCNDYHYTIMSILIAEECWYLNITAKQKKKKSLIKKCEESNKSYSNKDTHIC